MLQTKTILNNLRELNKIDIIKTNEGKERIFFINSDKVFKLFSDSENGLNPFDDYSYKWLNDFLDSFIDSCRDEDDINENIENFENDLYSYIDSTTEIYTNDLTKWLNDNNNNVYYLTQVLEEGEGLKDGFQLLQLSQYRAIQEHFYYYLSCLKDYIEELNEGEPTN